jgi:hypothetical protein
MTLKFQEITQKYPYILSCLILTNKKKIHYGEEQSSKEIHIYRKH